MQQSNADALIEEKNDDTKGRVRAAIAEEERELTKLRGQAVRIAPKPVEDLTAELDAAIALATRYAPALLARVRRATETVNDGHVLGMTDHRGDLAPLHNLLVTIVDGLPALREAEKDNARRAEHMKRVASLLPLSAKFGSPNDVVLVHGNLRYAVDATKYGPRPAFEATDGSVYALDKDSAISFVPADLWPALRDAVAAANVRGRCVDVFEGVAAWGDFRAIERMRLEMIPAIERTTMDPKALGQKVIDFIERVHDVRVLAKWLTTAPPALETVITERAKAIASSIAIGVRYWSSVDAAAIGEVESERVTRLDDKAPSPEAA